MNHDHNLEIRFMPLSKRHADEIHAQLMKMNWTKEEIRRRTGIDRAGIKRFVDRKRASVVIGARIAIAIAAEMAVRENAQR